MFVFGVGREAANKLPTASIGSTGHRNFPIPTIDKITGAAITMITAPVVPGNVFLVTITYNTGKTCITAIMSAHVLELWKPDFLKH